jgi:hypothetical protein
LFLDVFAQDTTVQFITPLLSDDSDTVQRVEYDTPQGVTADQKATRFLTPLPN